MSAGAPRDEVGGTGVIGRRRLIGGSLLAVPMTAIAGCSGDGADRRQEPSPSHELTGPAIDGDRASTGDVTRVVVTDFGAVGDGVTDDSDAIARARDAVLSMRINEGQVTRELFFPAGTYRVTKPDTLLSTPRAGTADQIRGYTIRGVGKRTSEIYFDSAAEASEDRFANNLMTAANRLRAFRVSSMSFRSQNPHQSWIYCWSRDDRDADYEEPDFGAGSNHDFVLVDVEWRGQWKRGIGLDGDQVSNLNSEWVFLHCHINNTGTFADAFLHAGMSPHHRQQDQFLNYWFYSCKFEYSHGTLLKLSKGGFVNVFGGSWIAGIGTDEPAIFFHMPEAPHFASTQTLVVVGTRFELRHSSVRLLDSAWAGAAAHITFQGVSDSAHGFQPWASDANTVIVRARDGEIPTIRFTDCELMGYHEVVGAQPRRGRIIYDGCNFTNHSQGGLGATTGFLRYQGSPPSYRFIDCYGVDDASA